jgi:hypothetical protein
MRRPCSRWWWRQLHRDRGWRRCALVQQEASCEYCNQPHANHYRSYAPARRFILRLTKADLCVSLLVGRWLIRRYRRRQCLKVVRHGVSCDLRRPPSKPKAASQRRPTLLNKRSHQGIGRRSQTNVCDKMILPSVPRNSLSTRTCVDSQVTLTSCEPSGLFQW